MKNRDGPGQGSGHFLNVTASLSPAVLTKICYADDDDDGLQVSVKWYFLKWYFLKWSSSGGILGGDYSSFLTLSHSHSSILPHACHIRDILCGHSKQWI